MYCSTRSPSLQRLDADKGKWVTYQLRLRKITHAEVARRAGCTRTVVTNVLSGRISSAKVYVALCAILGLPAISELLAGTERKSAIGGDECGSADTKIIGKIEFSRMAEDRK